MLAVLYAEELISTHALREEGDSRLARRQNSSENFYPRPPRGGRQQNPLSVQQIPLFLPTPSARRATPAFRFRKARTKFLPTPSARRATVLDGKYQDRQGISTHALREEGDRSNQRPDGHRAGISTHALREEGDDRMVAPCGVPPVFLPTPSARRATGSR